MIRQIEARDAAPFVALSTRLDEETKLMLFEPGERLFSPQDQSRRIDAMLSSGSNQVVFVAEQDGELVGFIGATAGTAHRNQHIASFTVGVLKKYWGKGLGSQLIGALLHWAEARKLRRLELTVMTHNLRAVSLYLRHGFVVEGKRERALCIDGKFVDEYWMSRLVS